MHEHLVITIEVKLLILVMCEDREDVKEDGIKLTTSEVVIAPKLHHDVCWETGCQAELKPVHRVQPDLKHM